MPSSSSTTTATTATTTSSSSSSSPSPSTITTPNPAAMSAPPNSSPLKDPPSPTATPDADADGPVSPAGLGSPSLSPSSDRSPSPLPPMASHPLPPLPPSSLAPPSASASRRLAAPIWTHEETLALIDAYREKWYELRRGNLRANHWQDVAEDVSRRCPSGPSPPKSSVQCRHKVEKLRKRYRSERNKSLRIDPSLAPTSSWVYFRKMDAMEHGGGIVSGQRRPSAPSSPAPPRLPSDDDEDEEEDDGDYDAPRGLGGGSNTRSMHRMVANGRGAIGELRFTIPKAVRSKVSRPDERPAPSASINPSHTARFVKGYSGGSRTGMEEMRRKLEKRRRRMEMESGAMGEMVTALKMLGDGFLRMEQRKMEMAREMEKVRMDMELKRTELILDSQRRIVDAFLKGLSSKKRAKISPED